MEFAAIAARRAFTAKQKETNPTHQTTVYQYQNGWKFVNNNNKRQRQACDVLYKRQAKRLCRENDLQDDGSNSGRKNGNSSALLAKCKDSADNNLVVEGYYKNSVNHSGPSSRQKGNEHYHMQMDSDDRPLANQENCNWYMNTSDMSYQNSPSYNHSDNHFLFPYSTPRHHDSSAAEPHEAHFRPWSTSTQCGINHNERHRNFATAKSVKQKQLEKHILSSQELLREDRQPVPLGTLYSELEDDRVDNDTRQLIDEVARWNLEKSHKTDNISNSASNSDGCIMAGIDDYNYRACDHNGDSYNENVLNRSVECASDKLEINSRNKNNINGICEEIDFISDCNESTDGTDFEIIIPHF